MIKSKGDKKVQNWEHLRSGLGCGIYLRGTKFAATFLEKEFEAPDINIIQNQLRDYAEHWITMEWFPVIEIEIEAGEGRYRSDPVGETVSLNCKRFYLSLSPAGEIFEVEWDVDADHRKAKMTNYGRYSSELKLTGLPLRAPLKTGRGEKYLMDYTNDLWDKFEQIARGILALRETLHKLVSTKQGISQLLKRSGEKLLLGTSK